MIAVFSGKFSEKLRHLQEKLCFRLICGIGLKNLRGVYPRV
ncbi:MAG: hypothetical protein BWX87_00349 [Bacteroidetes bacterium ADurb.Bin123]|nr:MAG: hypothetical protein BWX87_00349 [Bacteroidetes bacterium ADurb.Bin123]